MEGARQISLKPIGVLLAYAPGARLTREGLGRYMSAFIRSAIKSRRVVLAVPSWSRKHMHELLDDAGIDPRQVEIIGPRTRPILLSIYLGLQGLVAWLTRRRGLRRRGSRVIATTRRHLRWVAGRTAATRNPIILLAFGAYLAILTAIGIVIAIPIALVRSIQLAWKLAVRTWPKLARVRPPIGRIRHYYMAVVQRMFQDMHRQEMALIARAANAVEGVPAWYSPTAFWSTGNMLRRKRLICVPDVIFAEFPVAFADGINVLEISRSIEQVLREGTDFVAYSDRTKQRVLIDRFGVPPERISIVRHAPMTLLRHIDVQGYADAPKARRERAKSLLAGALGRSVNRQPVISKDFAFIFFPTQFRPSKNVLTLLRAYQYLKSAHLFGHKLVLTGNPRFSPEIEEFIRKNRLELDVLFLKDLTEGELAACYHLADLAVNSSISEGGMPFTFTEALSVETPVIMGDIEVTREIITDPALADATLFDPYDWRALADKIEWGIANRASLLALQRKFYQDELLKRTWDDVVAEHLVLLDAIGDRSAAPA